MSEQKGGFGAWTWLLAGGLASAAVACGSGAETCQDSRTCATADGGGGGTEQAAAGAAQAVAGTAGDAGASDEPSTAGGAPGAGGSPASPESAGAPGDSSAGATGEEAEGGAAGSPSTGPEPQCQVDADCNDYAACNGVERCEAGECIQGPPPVCANPDTQHCAVECVENGNAYQCAAKALDSDKDGHGTDKCMQNPGDDCDDAKKTVYSGATELCDLLDNDCDGKVDLDDGLLFDGQQQYVGRDLDPDVNAYHAVMAWSDEAKVFGLAWSVEPNNVMFATYDAKGKLKAGPHTVASGDESVGLLAIAPGAGGFGVAWNSAIDVVGFRTVSPSGQLGKQVWVPGREGPNGLALAWHPSSKAWGLVADHGVAATAADGTPTELIHLFNKVLNIDALELFATPRGFLVGTSASSEGQPSARVVSYLSDFSQAQWVDAENLTDTSALHVAAHKDGAFAVLIPATAASGSARVDAFDANGKLLCSATKVRATTGRATGITATASGYTVAFRSEGATGLSFVEVGNDCKLGQVVTTEVVHAGDVAIVASPTSYGISWRNYYGESMYSIFGANYCN